ncbi:MAG TPA: benzoylformate decarboxylase [Acidimicrobiales bacterium]|nr:benzoylformate decarboxylase [Acidimicrobiales bacterium]
MTTVRAATHSLMRALGMTTIFGNPGSTELRFFKDAPADFDYVLALQESSAVAMADGYAQAARNAGFVNLHSAVGVGHALGSIFTAMRNQTPLVITAGQQSRELLTGEPFLFSEQAAELPKPYVKWSVEPARAADVPAAIARAYYTAMTPPMGPTFVSIPEDDWDAPAVEVAPREVRGEFVGEPEALGAVAAALNESACPALVVGAGVDRDGAWDLVVALAERTGATVWVSPLSGRCSFPEDHPAFAGFLTPARARLAEQLAPHDVVVVLGAPVFTYHVRTEGQVVADGTTLFLLTDDPDAAAFAPVGAAVLTTLRRGVADLLGRVTTSGRSPLGRALRAAPPATEPISGAFVMHMVGEAMPEAAAVVEEAPSHRNAMHDHLPIRHSGSFYCGASGGLGWALPAAVGISLADPGRRVMCLLGDGSSLYSIQALWTAAERRLPITFVILNNRGYSALKAFGLAMGIETLPGVNLPGIDFVDLAIGFGVSGERVDRAERLEPALRASFEQSGPRLLDVMVDATVERLY